MTLGIVAIAWIYVVLMMAVAEALSPQGTLLGAFFTLVLYGIGPLALVLYLMGTPMRRRRQREQQGAESAASVEAPAAASTGEGAGSEESPRPPPAR